MKWWFERNESYCGPVKKETLQQMLANNEIGRETLVWCMPMDEWAPAHSIEELCLPPPLPRKDLTISKVKTNKNNAEDALIIPKENQELINCNNEVINLTPWRRFFARNLDAAIFSLLFVICFRQTIFSHTENYINIVFVYVIFMISIEALVVHMFGTTLGKFILSIKVTTIDGKRLNFGSALERSVKVWFFNAFYIVPVIPMFTQFYHYRQLMKKGKTSYDDGWFDVSASSKPNYVFFVLMSAVTLLFWVVVIN